MHHLRVLGSLVHVKIISTHVKKLDDRSIKMVFLGYEPGSKAYRVYDPKAEKLRISSNTIFEEDKGWDSAQVLIDAGAQTWVVFTVHFDPSQAEGEQDVPTQTEAGLDTFSPASRTRAPHNTAALGTLTAASSIGLNQEPGSSESMSSSERPHLYRLLQEVYDETMEVNDEVGLCFVSIHEPVSFEEATGNGSWQITTIRKNNTWEYAELPQGHRAIGLKWVFKVKKNPEGDIVKHKVRLVAKGYVQKQGIDFNEFFALVTRMEIVRLLLALAAQENWDKTI